MKVDNQFPIFFHSLFELQWKIHIYIQEMLQRASKLIRRSCSESNQKINTSPLESKTTLKLRNII